MRWKKRGKEKKKIENMEEEINRKGMEIKENNELIEN